jgi:iron complex transport system ATP-binding protein
MPRRRVAQRLGLLLQQQETRLPASVLDTVLAARYPYLGPWRDPMDADRQLAHRALASLGLEGLERRNIQTLSGGERQRVAIAVLLTQEPQVMLLDEPVSHLDLHEQIRVLELMRGLARRGHAVLMTLHDLNLALGYCDHLLLLHRARALAGPTSRLGRRSLLSRIYGQRLIALDGPKGPVMVPG